jgi:FtsP/CotA-like multicopper oxidase with cupredoxin domain
MKNLSRRDFLKIGTLGTLSVGGLGWLIKLFQSPASATAHTMALTPTATPGTMGVGGEMSGMDMDDGTGNKYGLIMPGLNGDVDHQANGFNPTDLLTDFDGGTVSTLPNGQVLREYRIVAGEQNIELVPGLKYYAWTYNGRIPGPTIRAREGDHIRIEFLNGSSHEHSMHFHGIHPGNMDGVYEQVLPGGSFTYEFDAAPFGVHLYHCHAAPLAKHISKGLYGAFIVEPRNGWPTADHEFVMVMSGFDVDYDGQNDFYVVNGIPFHYDRHPIQIKVGELVRIFLVNILEFDPINSFHLHANFFQYYPTATSLTPSEYTDTIALMQAQRGMLEFRYPYPGRYMFHAHKTEFAELGWTGVFEVTE